MRPCILYGFFFYSSILVVFFYYILQKYKLWMAILKSGWVLYPEQHLQSMSTVHPHSLASPLQKNSEISNRRACVWLPVALGHCQKKFFLWNLTSSVCFRRNILLPLYLKRLLSLEWLIIITIQYWGLSTKEWKSHFLLKHKYLMKTSRKRKLEEH